MQIVYSVDEMLSIIGDGLRIEHNDPSKVIGEDYTIKWELDDAK